MTAGDANARLEGAFLQLIKEKHFAKITVNDIVEKAGVHRNTFYYHYQSIPTMLSEMCRKKAEEIISQNKSAQNPTECILQIVQYSRDYRSMILHVYESEARGILLNYARRIGYSAIETYLDNATTGNAVNRHDREVMVRFYTAGVIGVWTDWVEEGMESDPSEDFIRICRILEKTSADIFSE
ncbi:MAG: TetR/AcrR family transcriptional regulator [Eubacteriales bacterium]|nr:TetR/AcrR family transcriptional regulator [Eubacteriales bacterium]